MFYVMQYVIYGLFWPYFCLHGNKMAYVSSVGNTTQYIYLDSKLLAPVACTAKLVKTGLGAIWAEQNAPYT